MQTAKVVKVCEPVPVAERLEPFATNLEFLLAIERQLNLLVQRGGLQEKMRMKVDQPEERREVTRQLRWNYKKYAQLWTQHRKRLQITPPEVVPFVQLCEQFQLDELEQEVVQFLFLSSVSSEFRHRLAALDQDQRRYDDAVSIGLLLRLLRPDDLAAQMAARSVFSMDGTLLRYNLISCESERNRNACILSFSLDLNQRIVNWISGDANRYVVGSPCTVERPEIPLEQVVLSPQIKERVLGLVGQASRYQEALAELGTASRINYGRSIVILEYGPPGTGKTLFAKALSTYTGRPLISPRSDIQYRYRDSNEILGWVFREAQLQKGIVFLDECEEYCAANSQEVQTLMLLLEQAEVIVILATNKPEELAPALDRRCTLKLNFTLPDLQQRRQIWERLIPEGVSLADDVDLDQLAAQYPMAGGYIKNAVLSALYLGMTTQLAGRPVLDQKLLMQTASWQEQHIGGICGLRRIIKPACRLEDCLITTEQQAQLAQIARTAGVYRQRLLRWFETGQAPASQMRGYKLLLRTNMPRAGMQVAEGLARQIGLNLCVVRLGDVLTSTDEGGYLGRSSRTIRGMIRHLFASISESGMVLAFEDDQYHLLDPTSAEQEELLTLRELFELHEGVAIIVTGAVSSEPTPSGFRFHETLTLDHAAPEVCARQWEKVLSSGLSLAEASGLPTHLAGAGLTPEQIGDAMHLAALRLADRPLDMPLDPATLQDAFRQVQRWTSRRTALFGADHAPSRPEHTGKEQ